MNTLKVNGTRFNLDLVSTYEKLEDWLKEAMPTHYDTCHDKAKRKCLTQVWNEAQKLRKAEPKDK